MLTVHASKGLEFPVVYIAQVAKGRFPLKKQSSSCTLPPGLLAAPGHDWHLEEEQCLFFVALSRARDTLWLSRAKRYGKQNSNPSDFLSDIRACIPHDVDIDPTLQSVSAPANPAGAVPTSGSLRLSNRELETYLRCPKQYFFDSVLALGGRRTNSGYLQFHRCVYQVLAWMSSEQSAGRPADPGAVLIRLEEVWVASGPQEHPYHDFYRHEAQKLLRDAIQRVQTSSGKPLDLDWEIPVPHGVVTIRPDHITLIEEPRGKFVSVQRWRTGKPPKKSPSDEIYSLYAKGAELAHPGAQITVEALYLSTSEVQEVSLTAKNIRAGLEKYDDALADILRGEFPPAPSDWNCPRCPHYFICPAAAFAKFVKTQQE